jgi:hypothetical protein
MVYFDYSTGDKEIFKFCMLRMVMTQPNLDNQIVGGVWPGKWSINFPAHPVKKPLLMSDWQLFWIYSTGIASINM